MQVLGNPLHGRARSVITTALIPGVVALSTIATAGEALGQEAPVTSPSVLRLLVVNRAHVRASMLQASEEDAEAIYEATGVQTRWANVTATDASSDYAIDFIVIIVSGTESRLMAARQGDNVLGLASRESGIAWVLYDRVADNAAIHCVPFRRLLGQVIAHEVGHLLLPANSHSDHGIMQRRLNTRSSLREYFTAAQAEMIRQHVASLRCGQHITCALQPLVPSMLPSDGTQATSR